LTFSTRRDTVAPPKTFPEVKTSTIREVAEQSGVSVSTVSRVFNGYDDVSAATRERVLATARLLDYAPSAAARTLVRRRSELIGVVLFTGREHPDIGHPFFQDVLVGLKHGIGSGGYDVLLFATEQPHSSEDGAHSYMRRARHHHVDGIVLMGVDLTDPEVLRLLEAEIPLVGVDLDVSGPHASHVSSDNVGGARLAVKHLRELGHRRIATIAGPQDTKPGADRLLGFRAELQTLPQPGYEQIGDFYTESGESGMQALLALPEPPTAVFVASDLMAVGAIKAAREAGLSVPGDLAVVGFDDIQLASLVDPPLTTIRQDRVGLGQATARALIEQIENPETIPAALTLPVELVVRKSSGEQKKASAKGGEG
jgi:LacI family transcriptional regulator